MVNVSEHVYHDDPAVGHPDVRTKLAGVSYFFLGNGAIQAAVQFAPSGEGTPLGLLIMDPERLRKKREALTQHAERGLEPTVVEVVTSAGAASPDPAVLSVAWDPEASVPTVEARWDAGGIDVIERFCCPAGAPRISRAVEVVNRKMCSQSVTVQTAGLDAPAGATFMLASGARAHLWIAYDLDPDSSAVVVRLSSAGSFDAPDPSLWSERTTIGFHDPLLDRLFLAARYQLPAVVSARGRLDGSIWQYNREWVRDQAVIALALTQLGHRAIGATILRRLLQEFVTADGATLDSSEVRGRDDVELDQNGMLLHVLEQYVWWTGDLALVADTWPKVAALAEYPLRPEFRHAPSGMLSGRREYWERHAAHGIEPGLELAYQVFVSLGLASAASLATRTGHPAEAARWGHAASALRDATLLDPRYALHDGRGFIKRRRLDGNVQEQIEAQPDSGLPDGVPLASQGPHLLNPDTCTVLPIALGFVDPASPLVRPTLEQVEQLWNQAWPDGGYGRYHASSEPDSPGGWPFASVFVARAAVEAGSSAPFWRVLRWMDTEAGSAAGSWFEYYGPRFAPPFPQVGIVPWTWAELVLLFVSHVLGVRPGPDGIRVRPRLPAGLHRVSARLPVGRGWLVLDVEADAGAPPDRAVVVAPPTDVTTLHLSVQPLP